VRIVYGSAALKKYMMPLRLQHRGGALSSLSTAERS
jgi:hypothetical protein